ncbi:hypothetical protein NEOLEDRAFT_1149194 [Neolentinus lepideus HHB14362 ss-1]|uniref:BHLH domain-containing protein n=1 Tax=Neolentinus lepideus HHB14362 ss-1 TaxID=1314782 RepID=A0A165RDY6_9AGAM|nr:hypothetical protein NEOLEDRAFT_1149194 [Neolentinus lepideus HHB14362 ss-1]
MNLFSSGDLASMMGMPGIESGQGQSRMAQTTSPEQMVLEQQLRMAKLQQLQQLQNQIFQQQLELINGQGAVNSSIEPPRDSQSYHGLPTPMSSGELRPQPSADFVSPIDVFQQREYHARRDQQQQSGGSHPPPDSSPAYSPHHHASQYNPTTVRSAPPDLVFDISRIPLSSPVDMELDLPPISGPYFSPQEGPSRLSTFFPVHNKRSASNSGDETSNKPSRKRQSPLDARPMAPLPSKASVSRGTKSASSTPVLTGRRKRGGSIVTEIVGDTPSPVDLSMPPPAPPSQATSPTVPTPSNVPPNLMPATPGGIMGIANMGLNSGLTPPPSSQSKNETRQKSTKTRSYSKSVSSKDAKNEAAVRQSPSLKPILPAGGSSSLAMASTMSSSQPVVPGRKTSHKAAEQARRDQIKAAYNDLRMLLPPIPMPSSDTLSSESMLPGSMPPRGPPKGDGPNKAVSKLQLLLCGNDYIRKLKGRVERRDEEINKLREEVQRLRIVAGEAGDGEDDLDLERDLDAQEPVALTMGSVGGDGDDADEEED